MEPRQAHASAFSRMSCPSVCEPFPFQCFSVSVFQLLVLCPLPINELRLAGSTAARQKSSSSPSAWAGPPGSVPPKFNNFSRLDPELKVRGIRGIANGAQGSTVAGLPPRRKTQTLCSMNKKELSDVGSMVRLLAEPSPDEAARQHDHCPKKSGPVPAETTIGG